jgi:intracellular sulfur oxidation DsrE/DsrF family protein
MNTTQRQALVISTLAFIISLSITSYALAEEYDAMKGINSVNAIFDMRDSNPQTAVIHLNLIHDTYNDLVAMKKTPVFVVVFMAGAVKLISTDHGGYNADEQKYLKEIAGIISSMSKAGIRVEICLFAANLFGVKPASILPMIQQVGNGWISEIGYQARGYSLVPVY